MFLPITQISDVELQNRRALLDQVIQANQGELTLLNRESDRRERERHLAAQAEVIALEGRPAWESEPAEETAAGTVAPSGCASQMPDEIVVASGDGVVIEAA